MVLGLLLVVAGLPDNLRASALGLEAPGHPHNHGQDATAHDGNEADFAWAECHSGPDCLVNGIFARPQVQVVREVLRGPVLFAGRLLPEAWRPLFEPPPPRLVS